MVVEESDDSAHSRVGLSCAGYPSGLVVDVLRVLGYALMHGISVAENGVVDEEAEAVADVGVDVRADVEGGSEASTAASTAMSRPRRYRRWFADRPANTCQNKTWLNLVILLDTLSSQPERA